MRLGIGAIAVAFRPWRRLPMPRPEAARRPLATAAIFWGAMGGFASTLAHAGAPPVASCRLTLKLPPAGCVATTA